MSIAAAFSNGKQALRRGAFALATVAAMVGATTGAQAGQFTREECGLILETSRTVMRSLGADTLSTDFRRSLLTFISPDGKTLSCTGPAQIVTPTGRDIDAFNTIGGLLPFDIQARGVRQVAQLSPAPAPATLLLQ